MTRSWDHMSARSRVQHPRHPADEERSAGRKFQVWNYFLCFDQELYQIVFVLLFFLQANALRNNQSVSLFKVFCRICGIKLLGAALLKLVSSLSKFIVPLTIRGIVIYVSEKNYPEARDAQSVSTSREHALWSICVTSTKIWFFYCNFSQILNPNLFGVVWF